MEPFDFSQYVERRKSGMTGGRGEGYAFEGDLQVLRKLRSIPAVEHAVGQLVKLSKSVVTGDLLGTAVKVGPRQFGRVHRIAEGCAKSLGIPTPQIYIVPHHTINAMTAGTDTDAFIIIHSGALEQMTDEELRFIIGHECGHIQNNHVVYLTTLSILNQMARIAAGALLSPLLMPLTMALNGWSRAAEITCDRAGLLCCNDPDVAEAAFLKLAIGSKKLFEELNREAYLEQLREGRESIGRMGELTKTHPYITKRIEALRIFTKSDLYQKTLGQEGGLSREELEKQTGELIKVF